MTDGPERGTSVRDATADFEGFLRVDGSPLHVLVEGTGPVVVLSAGLGLGWFDWDPVAALLAPDHTVVRFDRPGHGRSGPVTAPPTLAGEADRIAGVLDALGPRAAGPATVVGHSLAGPHAEGFARRHPARTAALVLVDSSVEAEPPAPRTPPALRTALARAAGAGLTALALPLLLGPALRRAGVRAARVDGVDTAPRAAVRRCYGTGRVWTGTLLANARYPETLAELARLRETHPLTAPTTVLGAYDGSGRRRELDWLGLQAHLADLLGARFEVATPAGHLVQADRPRQVAHAIRQARG
ncbi:alpha/beta fold hydrolase [Streptomyces sp. BI20]|uniref:alpha/beta fold hydrolase n=1 Tax=Streptomyces sp. BI20 TaxID=3403460 RepID=UPI003C7947BD